MSILQDHKDRLEGVFEDLVSTHPDDEFRQRTLLNRIIQECYALKLAPWVYLQNKVLAGVGTSSPQPVYGSGKVVQRGYKCEGCGKPYPTKQARAGHRPHCPKKGGGHA